MANDLMSQRITSHSSPRAVKNGDALSTHPETLKQQLVLLTGAYGDEPSLVYLRRRLRGCDVLVIEPPGIYEPDSVLRDISRMAEVIAPLVHQRFPHDRIHLAGFSYGGVILGELAAVLQRAGRDVASLCLLDAPYDTAAVHYSYGPKRSFWVRAREAVLLLPGYWRPTRFVAASIYASFSGKRRLPHNVRRRLLYPLRERALTKWRHVLPPVPTTLVIGDGLGSRNLEQWSALLPSATIIRLPGGHADLLKTSNMAAVVAVMEKGMDTAHRPPVACAIERFASLAIREM